jgi:hypothetical protein
MPLVNGASGIVALAPGLRHSRDVCRSAMAVGAFRSCGNLLWLVPSKTNRQVEKSSC